MDQGLSVLCVFGTRPEAVKMAPVCRELGARPDRFRLRVAVTGQHREMLDQVLACFQLEPDCDLDIMTRGQSLSDVTVRVLVGLEKVIGEQRPDLFLVQGDTASMFAGALAAYYAQVPVGHVEAGLRTDNIYDPFPEEMMRRLATQIASVHFAPTAQARRNLTECGVAPEAIYLTGNTVVDALQQVADRAPPPWPPDLTWVDDFDGKLILATAHRRENIGTRMEGIFGALREIAQRHEDVRVVYAAHRNPRVREIARAILGGAPRVRIIEPPEYLTFVHLLKRATLVITDSGGIQEEAPALGVPALVVRETTERPEGVAAGVARLVGTDREAITAAADELLGDPGAYREMARAVNPYGDGHAAVRIADAIEHFMGRRDQRPADFTPA